MKDLQTIVCPIQRAATLVADVTVIIIIRELQAGPRRFGQLLIPGLNPRALSERLRRLTQEGILERTPYAEAPPRVEYRLTAKGQALWPILQALQGFGETWLPVAIPDPNSVQNTDLANSPEILCPENKSALSSTSQARPGTAGRR
jgi:DNA-binding HxlR family transcriptional regulator